MVPSQVDRRHAAMVRADALIRVTELADRDPGSVLPWLIGMAGEVDAVRRLRLWRIDQALFGVGRRASLMTVSRTLDWCGVKDRKPGVVSLAWVLDPRSNGSRLAAWLACMSLRESGGVVPLPDPYRFRE